MFIFISVVFFGKFDFIRIDIRVFGILIGSIGDIDRNRSVIFVNIWN